MILDVSIYLSMFSKILFNNNNKDNKTHILTTQDSALINKTTTLKQKYKKVLKIQLWKLPVLLLLLE